MSRARIAVVATVSAVATLCTSITTPAVALASPIHRAILGAGANETQATVSWRTFSFVPEAVTLFPTAAPDQARTFAGADVDRGALLYRSLETTLTDLQPNTEYTYRIGSDARGWSPEYTFRTGTFGKEWSFLALADAQIGVKLGNSAQGATWRTSISEATARDPEASLVLSLGDQIDGWGEKIGQYNEFFSPDELRTHRVAVSNGNHDEYVFGERHFNEHFSLPNEVGDTANYFYEYNNALFIALDSNDNSPEEIDQHIAFLRDVVAKHGANKDWTVVTFHHSPFSQGSHTNDPEVVQLRNRLTPVLSELGVDLVFGGHDHIYTRSHLMNGNEAAGTPRRGEIGDRLEAKKGQTLYITTTSAGGGKYYDFHDVNGVAHPGATRENIDPSLEHPWTAMWNQDYTPDFLDVQVKEHELTATTYDVNSGEVIDAVTLVQS